MTLLHFCVEVLTPPSDELLEQEFLSAADFFFCTDAGAELVLLPNFLGSERVCCYSGLERKMAFVVMLSFFQKVAAAYYLYKTDCC